MAGSPGVLVDLLKTPTGAAEPSSIGNKRKFYRITGKMRPADGAGVTDSNDRYFAKPTAIPGRFTLWDRRSNSAVYGVELASKNAVEAVARRLNAIYRRFLDHGAAVRPE